MTNKHHVKKESNTEPEIKQIDDSKVDEIILEAEKEGDSAHVAAERSMPAISAFANFGQSISSIIIFILLVLSLVQSVELINLKKEIQKGQFSGQSNSAPAASQGLPAQQGGC